MILVDTHVLLWLQFRPERLGEQTRRIIDQARDNRDVAVSAITFWETALLRTKRRLDLIRSIDDVSAWRRELLAGGLREIPIDGELGIHSVSLNYPGGDPADRLIIATALDGSHLLVTDDRQILGWPGQLDRQRASE